MTTPHLSPIVDDETLKRLATHVAAVSSSGRTGWNKNELLKLAAQIVVAGLVAWGTVNTRIAVLETRVDDLRAAISEIRTDVKVLLQREFSR